MTDSNWPAIDELGRVLDHRRAAGDQRAAVAAGPARTPPARPGGSATSPPASTASENAVVSTTPGSVVEAGHGGAGQGGRLAAGERRVEGGLVAEVDDEGTHLGQSGPWRRRLAPRPVPVTAPAAPRGRSRPSSLACEAAPPGPPWRGALASEDEAGPANGCYRVQVATAAPSTRRAPRGRS